MTIETRKNVNQVDDKNNSYLDYLDYKRTEVQKIINNHFKKDDDKWFSVMDWSNEQLDTLIDILTWRKTRKELETRRKQNIREMQMLYDQILCENDLNNSLKQLAKDTRYELSSFKSDLLLE